MARKSFLLRIDPEVFAALEKWAADDLRSVNGQIEFLLRQALANRGVPLPDAARPVADPPADAGRGVVE